MRASFRPKDADTDQNPGANIRVKNESTGFQTGTITNVSGEYQLQQLPLGKPYSITITFVGYQTQKFSNYALNQGDKLKVDVKLLLGQTQLSEVVVSANSFVNKETERAGAAIAVTSLQMKQLPMEGRNFTALTALNPRADIFPGLISKNAYVFLGPTTVARNI